MYTQTLRLAIIAAAFMFAVPAMAQDWHSDFNESAHQFFTGGQNCGRAITQHQAEGLWAGYCNENCAYSGGVSKGKCGCGGGCLGKCRNSGGGSCDSGSFGYPAGGGGCTSGGCGGGKLGSRHGGYGGGCGGKLKGLHGGGCGAGCGGKLKGLHGGGCGCKLKGLHSGGFGGKLKGLHGGCGCKLFGGCKKFGHSAQQCGTSGAYFDEAVGFEYGTSGIQSCVSCNSCGSFDALAPQMAEPCCQSQSFIGSGVDSMVPAQMYGVPSMAEPAAGAIGALN